MMRSLFSGVQGLRAHQVRMDVIGNNIANVNTVAFKGGRVNFSDALSQLISGAAIPSPNTGGINPKQVGLGVSIASIDAVQTAGSMQLTGKPTDMAISGGGFFVVRENSRKLYTRAGSFDFDATGYLVNPATGQRVQGWMANSAGVFAARDTSTLSDIQVPLTNSLLAKATSSVSFDQALNASAPVGTVHTVAYSAYDSLGREQAFTLNFTKVANNAWDIRAFDPSGATLTLSNTYGAATVLPAPAAGDARIQFNTNGSLMDDDGNANTPFVVPVSYTPAGAATMSLNLDFSTIIQPALPGSTSQSTLRAYSKDGYAAGLLSSISVDSTGTVTGYYSNGGSRPIAQVAMANFANPSGLTKESGNNWGESVNSGIALIGVAGEGGRGMVVPNSLEMSNVDLSVEFTNMIVTQRGFQANSRVITTTDELLQEVVSLKR